MTLSPPALYGTPVFSETEREAISQALHTCGLVEPPNAKVIQIKDTLHLAEVLVSEKYLEELSGRKDLERLSEPQEMAFDAVGNLRAVDDRA